MKIKRFVDKDSRGAMAQARSALGPEAVILSNKRVNGQIELVAAVDLEEIAAHGTGEQEIVPSGQVANLSLVSNDSTLSSLQQELSNLRSMVEGKLSDLAWQDMAGIPSAKAALQARLAELGLSRGMAGTIADHLPIQEDLDAYWKLAVDHLVGRLCVPTPDSMLDSGGLVALLGATGVGKTTTIAKLAARYVLRHGKEHLALVTTDCYRVGGQEQLQAYANYLDVPLFAATDESELRLTLDQLQHKKMVLIDTGGMSQRDPRLRGQFAMLNSVGYDIDCYAVLAATAPQGVLHEVINVFGANGLSGSIVTKLDEAVGLGGILEVAIESQLPLAYATSGQQVPEDLLPVRADDFVHQVLDIAVEQPASLSETLQESLSAKINRALST